MASVLFCLHDEYAHLPGGNMISGHINLLGRVLIDGRGGGTFSVRKNFIFLTPLPTGIRV